MKMKKADIFVAIYILTAFIMFIVTLPNWLLDIFLAINIATAFTIMFSSMFVKEVLEMSYFPTILLFTTIFRIALNSFFHLAHPLYSCNCLQESSRRLFC